MGATKQMEEKGIIWFAGLLSWSQNWTDMSQWRVYLREGYFAGITRAKPRQRQEVS